MRFLHILVIATLVAAAAGVYRIKFEATMQAETLARLRNEIRRERDAVATLRAQWARLDNPARIQGLAERHLPLKPLDAAQIGAIESIPERPPQVDESAIEDPIAAIIGQEAEIPTGSLPADGAPR